MRELKQMKQTLQNNNLISLKSSCMLSINYEKKQVRIILWNTIITINNPQPILNKI
jgi:hypothetical protein